MTLNFDTNKKENIITHIKYNKRMYKHKVV